MHNYLPTGTEKYRDHKSGEIVCSHRTLLYPLYCVSSSRSIATESQDYYRVYTSYFLCDRFLEQIGSGHSAKICKALWECESEAVMVAIKSLKESSLEGDQVRFLQEAAIMGQFWHPNVIFLHGVVTIGNPVR